jgi:hypothetical protein
MDVQGQERRISVIGRTGSLLLIAVLAAVGLLVAGCGGGSHPSVASLGSTTTTGSTTPAGSSTTGRSGPSTGSNSQRSGGGGQFSIAGGGSRLTQLAACMRSHGEPNFPDPNAQGVISSSDLDPSSPQFQQAMQACQKDLPNGGTPSPAQQAQMRQQALAFSACMRKHGVPNFPDPQFSSGGRVTMKVSSGSGINPRSAQFQAAQKACQGDLPGRPGAATPGAAKSGGGFFVGGGK